MAGRFAGTVSNNIVKKTCGARPSTAAKGIDCLMGLVELEQGEKVLVRQLLSCHHVHAKHAAHSMQQVCLCAAALKLSV
jgi:hypothetical protein